MVARFFYGNPIEEEVNTLTSEDVPNHELEISSALNFADKVRSKEYSAKEVARILRKRFEVQNPNVLILNLKLVDICVKNGGGLIQLEISSREFIDTIVGLLDSKSGRDYELRQLILTVIQEWAVVLKGNNEMGYVAGVCERLKRMGHTMPKINVVASTAMGDTESAPEWEDSSVCQRCRTAFSFTNRKHHCRHCGKCFCQDCSSNSTPIPKFAIYEPVRVCHGCYLRLKKIVPSTDDQASSSKAKDTTDWSQMDRKTDTQTNAASAGTPDVNDDDEDLKLAIELSLKEAQQQPNYADFMRPTTTAPAAITTAAPAATTAVVSTPAYASQITYPSLTSNEPYPLTSEHGDDMDEEDDPDLRAAIEASLQDVKASTAGPDYLSAPVQSAPVYAETHHSLDFMPHVQEDDSGDEEPLASDERENVQLFESLLIRIRDSGQDIRYDPQIQYLHESIEQLHPKITDAMDHVDQKHKEFIKLHDRILTAIRIYDQLLDKRLRSSSLFSADMAPPSIASYTPAPPSSVYPAATSQSPMPAGHQSYYQAPPAQPAYSPLPQQQQLSVPSQPQRPDYLPQSPQGPVPVQYDQQQQQHTQSPLGPQPVYNEGHVHSLPQPLPQQQQPQQPQQPQLPQQQLPPQVPIYSAPPSQPYAPTDIHAQAPPVHAPYGTSQPKSPPVNPHYVPPSLIHVPEFPVLQPTSTNAPSTSAAPVPALSVASAPPVAVASAPEEAPLIEF